MQKAATTKMKSPDEILEPSWETKQDHALISQELSFSAKGQISAQLGFKKKADNPKPLLVKALKNGRLIVTKKISP